MRKINFRAWDGKKILKQDSNQDQYYFEFNDSTLILNVMEKYDEPDHEGEDFRRFVTVENAVFMQYTGLTDKNGVEIYEKDLINVCYTSSYGEFIHDCIFSVEINELKGLVLKFVKLLWVSGGYNQYPLHQELNYSNDLGYVYNDNTSNRDLYVMDGYSPKTHPLKTFPFNQEKVLAFHSRYLKIVGNIYENPELLSQL